MQIAKSFGADVTAVCSTTAWDLVRSIGADHVIDYSREDFTQSGQQYDLILVMGGNQSLSQLKRVLRPGGTSCRLALNKVIAGLEARLGSEPCCCHGWYATFARSHRNRTRQICNS